MGRNSEQASPELTRRGALLRGVFGDLGRLDAAFIGLPLLLFATLFAVCLAVEADVAISRSFYDAETGEWPLKHAQPFAWCYEHGCRPATVVGVTGLVIGLATLTLPRTRPIRKPALFLGLTLAIGPGILVNAVLKPNVARPRPYQTTDFGGDAPFTYIGAASDSGNHSFPSGHASMGFFFMTPALLFYRSRPALAAAVFLVGLSYGSLVGAARIVQGAHYASDVLGSALCVWGAAVFVLLCRRAFKSLMAAPAVEAEADEAVLLPMPQPADADDEQPYARAA